LLRRIRATCDVHFVEIISTAPVRFTQFVDLTQPIAAKGFSLGPPVASILTIAPLLAKVNVAQVEN